jgi:hypothetical protein
MNNGKVNIHGKEYETVASRVQRFRAAHPDWQIYTDIIVADNDKVIMRCDICDNTGTHIASGHAEEVRAATQINRTSALENCETSAIGRALAGAGFGGTEFASANEVQNAIAQQAAKPKLETVRTGKPLDQLEPLMRGCKTQDQLKVVWAALSLDERKTVEHIKDEIKGQLA